MKVPQFISFNNIEKLSPTQIHAIRGGKKEGKDEKKDDKRRDRPGGIQTQ
jgi:hypothetical protein